MEQPKFFQSGAKIKVVGCGGAGSNAVSRMVESGIHGVEFAVVNTDSQHLATCKAPIKIQLGARCTRGLGAGGKHEVGKEAAEESIREIQNLVEGSDMVFVAAGMGGGTGTGSAPVVAEMAKKAGALTIAIVTRPFDFEGQVRAQNAEEGLQALIPNVDTLVVVPNQRLFDICQESTQISVDEAFRVADGVLCNGVQAIAEVITMPGLINLDFADVRSIMSNAGPAWMSIGRGVGDKRVMDAAYNALHSPLLTGSIEGSKGIMFNVVGSSSLTLYEVNEAAEYIRSQVDSDANIIFGVMTDDDMGDEVRMTLIATGFDTADAYIEETAEDAYSQTNSYVKNVQAVRDMRSETELDIPSFLRTQSGYSSRRVAAPQSYSAQNVNPYSSYGSTYSVRPSYGQQAYSTRRAW
jgi:cell division protein FtsZ